MSKNNYTKKELQNFFGNSKDYYFFAADSSLSLFSMASHLQKILQCDFAYLGDFEPANIDYTSMHYKMLFSEIEKFEKLNFIIVENKTTLYFQQGYTKNKNEQKLNFHTLSMFDEYLYLFNKQGISLYNWNFSDYNYLFLIYTDKGFDIGGFLAKLKSIIEITLNDASSLLKVMNKRKDLKRVRFLEDLFCTAEIGINEYHFHRQERYLLPRRVIPTVNQLYRVYDDVKQTFNSDNIHLLIKDTTFE